MSQELVDPDIPSAFLRIDDTATGDDRAVSVHELQAVRDNHNILLARRCKRQIFALRFDTDDDDDGLIYKSARPFDRLIGDVLLAIPIFVENNTQSIQVNMRAALEDNAGPDAIVVGVIDGPNETRNLDTSVSMTFTTSTQTEASMTVPVPRTALYRQEGMLYLYGLTPSYSTVVETAVTIDDQVRNQIRADFTATTTGHIAAYSDKSITPSLVLAATSILSASTKDNYLDSQPDQKIDASSVTMEIWKANGLVVKEVTAWEVAVTDFAANRGAI